jgi:hypothetical protein
MPSDESMICALLMGLVVTSRRMLDVMHDSVSNRYYILVS